MEWYVARKIYTGRIFATGKQKLNERRIHPTQKPVALYEWLLGRYAKAGYKILDTHVGSASSLIACHRMGLQYVGFELSEKYYKKSNDRLEKEKSQLTFFDFGMERKMNYEQD